VVLAPLPDRRRVDSAKRVSPARLDAVNDAEKGEEAGGWNNDPFRAR